MKMRRQYQMGATLSYLHIALSVAMALVFAPRLLAAFGKEMYGVYGTIGGFVGMMAVMDLGLGNAVIRYVSKHRAEGDRAAMERFLGTVLALYAVIGAVIAGAGAVIYGHLPSFFHLLNAEELVMAQKLFLLVLGNTALSMLLNIFPGVLSAYERFVFPRTVALIRLAVRVVLLTLMLMGGTDPFQVTLLDTGLSIAATLCQVIYAIFVLRVRVGRPNFDRVLLRQIFSYSVFIFLNMIMDQVYWRIDSTLVTMLRGPTLAAITVISGNLIEYFMNFSGAIASMFLPRAVRMVSRRASGEELTDFMIRVGRLQLMIIALLVVGFGLVGRQFFALWVGGTIGADGVAACYAIVLMLMLALMIPLFENAGISIIQAKNKHAFRAVMLTVVSAFKIGLSIYLIRLWGPVGAAVATVISLVIGNTLISNWYYHYKIGLNIPRFFRDTLRGILPALLLITGVSCLTFLIPQDSWSSLLLRIGVIVPVYAGVMIAVGMNAAEREMLRDALHGVWRRLRPGHAANKGGDGA
ncbi:MAG: polysaccharide biosynthesis C-terminal domain-containing protein [Clostridia bacterium]|nr:polysaccharide biosynthesis C-terminal domain-containing protein [Clostridia bacterium]